MNGTEIVEKRNVLNEIRSNNMTLQELRFFSIYLSKINARDISTRKVKFKLEEFREIMGIEKVTIQHFKDTTNKLLGKVVNVPREDGKPGYIAFQIFKECEVYQDESENNQWYVEIDAHDRALPLMFNFKQNYFRYELWNALKLKSKNQLRLYELLKQYEHIGVREIKLEQLKDWLGIGSSEYPRWNNFRAKVIIECQVALKKYTDIEFDYEKIKAGRKVVGVKFIINKNKDYQDKIKLSEFIKNICSYQDQDLELENKLEDPEIKFIDLDNLENLETQEEYIANENSVEEFIEFLSGACNNEFSRNKMIVIKDLLIKAGYYKKPDPTEELEAYDYLLGKYHELNSKENIPKDDLERRFGLLKWLIKRDTK